jgi:DNA-directed RNA polymerase subunit F
MSNPKVTNEMPITTADLKSELEKIRKRDNALNFRAEKTEEYLQSFVTITDKEAKELYKKIEALEIPRMRPEHIVKIIDILPASPDEVKLVLQGYTITVTKENLKRISDAIQEATKKP